MSDIPVLLSAEGLSTDCTKPEKGRKVPMSKMDVELALERLRPCRLLNWLSRTPRSPLLGVRYDLG